MDITCSSLLTAEKGEKLKMPDLKYNNINTQASCKPVSSPLRPSPSTQFITRSLVLKYNFFLNVATFEARA